MAEFFNRQWRLPNNENKDKISNYSLEALSGGDFLTVEDFPFGSSQSFTISFWVYGADLISNSSKSFIGTEYYSPPSTSTQFGFALNFQYGRIQFYTSPINSSRINNFYTANNVLIENEWNHVILRYNYGTDYRIYHNNTLKAIYDSNYPNFVQADVEVQYNTQTLWMYRGYYVNYNLVGKMAEFNCFGYALTDTSTLAGQTPTGQVAAIYGDGSSLPNPMSLSPKPVAYYPLGDQDVYNGASYLVPNASLQDYVFDFDGSNDYINLGNNSVLQPATNYTFSIWFNADSYGYKTLFGSNTSTSSGVLALPTGNSMTYYHRTSTTTKQFNISLTDVPINNWHNFTITWSASTGIIRAFINGKVKAQLTGVSDINWGNELLIGRYYATYPFLFEGKLSNFAMWNTTLTDGFSGTPTIGDVAGGQVAEVYNNGSPQTTITGAPVGWWKLNAADTFDGTNWTISDYAGSNDGTSSGMTSANLVQSNLQHTSGYSPYALDFDGTNQAISLNSDIALSGDRSVNFWFTWRTAGVYLGGSNNNDYYPYILNATSVYLRSSSSSATSIVIPALQTGKFYNMCITGDGTTVSVYIDGSLAGTGTDIANITLNTIANVTSNAIGADGNMSNVAIWDNTVLSQSEVTEIYNSGVPSNLNTFSGTAPLSWWQLGSNSSFNNTVWTCLDEIGTNDGVSSNNMSEVDIVNGVGYTSNGVSSGMSDNLKGDAPYSTANSLSINMDVLDRSTDIPS